MKIVFYSTACNKAGGAALCLLEMLKEYRMAGIECIVVTKGKGNLSTCFAEIGVRSISVKSYDWLMPREKLNGLRNRVKWFVKSICNWSAEMKMYSLLRREKPDIYHINVIYNGSGAKAAHALKIPVVWHLREFAEVNDDTPFFVNSQKAYTCIAKSEIIICVSDCLHDYYSQYLPARKMIRIYDGIEFKAIERRSLDFERPILTLSGTSKVKGHSDAIEALALLRSNGYPDAKLQVCGRFVDKVYEGQLHELIRKLKLENAVLFAGVKDDMSLIWAQTDIALVCSRFESFGRSAVEAMAYKVPLVCAKSTGSYETTNNGEYCQLYKAGSVQELYKRITWILSNCDIIKNQIDNIAPIIQERYQIHKSAIELLEVFLNILKGDYIVEESNRR